MLSSVSGGIGKTRETRARTMMHISPRHWVTLISICGKVRRLRSVEKLRRLSLTTPMRIQAMNTPAGPPFARAVESLINAWKIKGQGVTVHLHQIRLWSGDKDCERAVAKISKATRAVQARTY